MDQLMGLPKQRALALLGVVLFGAVVLIAVFRPGDQASAGIDLDDPTAWIEHGIDGELLQVNAITGEVTARVDVAEPGQDFQAVPHGSGAALMNRSTSSVSIVSGAQLAVTSTIPISLNEGASSSGSYQVFGQSDNAANVIVLENDQLIQVDPQSGVSSETPLAQAPASVAQDFQGRLLTLDGEGSNIGRLGPRGMEPLQELAEPVGGRGDERSLVRSGGRVFSVDPARLSLTEVFDDGSLGLPVCMTSAASGALTGGSADNDDPLILAFNPESGVLSVSDPSSGCSDMALDIDGDLFGSPLASGDVAYIPNFTTGRIVAVDLSRERVIARLPFGSQGVPFELELFGSTVWANERQGPFAAVVDEFGIMPVAKISAIVAGQVAIDGEGEGERLAGADVEGSGLLVIGTSGEQVISASNVSGAAGPGQGPGTTSDEIEDLFDSGPISDTPQPDAVGIAIDGPGLDDAERELIDDSGTLIANFGVSSGKAIVGEILRFTDFSSGSPTSWTWDFGDGSGAREPNVEKSWSEPGIYQVILTVTNARGLQAQQSTEITIVPETVLIPPTADFSFDRNTIEEGESISFESRTVGEADLLEWNFGDGTSAIGPSATHTYDSTGEYTVTLTASNPAGSTDASTTVTVLSGVEAPVAAIGFLPSRIVNGQFVTLTSASLNEPTRLSWDFGDGTRGSGNSQRHAWDSPGTYRVRLTAENSEGSDSTFVDVVVAKRIDPPVSQFTQTATEVEVGQAVTFTNLSLNEPTKLIWNFGDDSTARGETATKSWSQPGRYRVTLRATNDAGTNRTGVTITVVRPVDPPVASFDVSRSVVAPNQSVELRDTSSNSPTSWTWDLSNGESSSNPNTTRQWSSPGTYTIRLTVKNEGGSSTAEKQIVVKEPPSANFRWEADGDSVKFTDTSWDDPETWRWDFGDGSTSNDRSPTHTFGSGEYKVTLVVSNGAGTSAPKTQTVSVSDPPVAVAECKVEGRSLRCTSDGSKNAVGYTWSSPEARTNSTPNEKSTTFEYAETGRFDVTLVVRNEAGTTDSVTIRSPRVRRGLEPRILDVKVASIDGNLVRLEAEFDRNPDSWQWSVDGAELVEGGNSSKPLFRVPSNGQYSGNVRASNEFGDDRDPFEFNFDGLTTEASFDWEVIEPGVVRFRNTSTARGDAEIQWRFNGAIQIIDENKQQPVVRYPDSGGDFRVVLAIQDANGSDIRRTDITVPGVGGEDPDDG